MNGATVTEEQFRSSLPASYGEKYRGESLRAHAQVAASRGQAPIHVGSFQVPDADLTGLCVVATDRPGLLSTISSALVFLGLEIESAEAYTRVLPDGPPEALDLFWVRRKDQNLGPLADADVARVDASLLDVENGRLHIPSTPPPPRSTERETHNTRVRFLEDKGGSLSTLEVETEDRSGLLMILTRALFTSRVQIVYSEVRTVERRVYDRFSLVELDGSPIEPGRRLEVQVAVLSAIERQHRAQQDETPNL